MNKKLIKIGVSFIVAITLFFVIVLSLELVADHSSNREYKFFAYNLSFSVFHNSKTVHKILETFTPLEPKFPDLQTKIKYYKMVIDNPEKYKKTHGEVEYAEILQINNTISYLWTLYYNGAKETFRKEYDLYSARFPGFEVQMLTIITTPYCDSNESDYLWALEKIKDKDPKFGNKEEFIQQLEDALNELK